jgi:hypothetical protein
MGNHWLRPSVRNHWQFTVYGVGGGGITRTNLQSDWYRFNISYGTCLVSCFGFRQSWISWHSHSQSLSNVLSSKGFLRLCQRYGQAVAQRLHAYHRPPHHVPYVQSVQFAARRAPESWGPVSACADGFKCLQPRSPPGGMRGGAGFWQMAAGPRIWVQGIT